MSTPTLINLPEPPSNPETPTEMPGTPNSTTTSLSCLSTTAIKDGHRGHSFAHNGLGGHHHTSSSNTLEAERADRISRLAGLERVSTARPNPNNPTSNAPLGPGGVAPGQNQIPGYFDQNGNPVYTTRMSTVGSASATGSASGGGQTTTWASGSTKGATETETEVDDDHMSMDTDDRDRYSVSAMDDQDDGMSDNTSLVGFGEGAGSTVSGPTYSRAGRSSLAATLQRDDSFGTPVSERLAEQQRRGDGRGFDEEDDFSVGRGGRSSTAVENAERIMRERLDKGEGKLPALGTPEEAGLGKFYFEEKK